MGKKGFKKLFIWVCIILAGLLIIRHSDAFNKPLIPPASSSGDDPVLRIDREEYQAYGKGDVHLGELILVSQGAPYEGSDSAEELVCVYDWQSSSFKVRDRTVQLKKEVMEPLNRMMDEFCGQRNFGDMTVFSGFRGYDEQKELYDEEVAKRKEEAAFLVAQPGCSEHHTGYAFDLGIVDDEGQSTGFVDHEQSLWFAENAYQYGFVLRYPEEKKALTGIAYEPWHFRYVGRPHAFIMYDETFCLEEYLDFLKTYEFGQRHLVTTDFDGGEYEIYFVPVGKMIMVPKSHAYNVSGNNQDGYIVTVDLAS